jgi:hypothetical protein
VWVSGSFALSRKPCSPVGVRRAAGEELATKKASRANGMTRRATRTSLSVVGNG